MGDKMNREYFEPATAPFNYNNVTGGADSASGGSAGSGMECMQLRSPPGPFHYLISEQAKSLVALQELQNEVGALLEFRDLVIETFPNLRSKMAPSTPAVARREWEPGVRVRRKLAAPGDSARAKPQPSVQDSGFSTETSCGKDAHSSASATAPRTRPEDELWALLDVIQRKGVRLRDEAELLRGELDETAEDSFARVLSASECACPESRRLRTERDALLARAAELEASALAARVPLAPHTTLAPHSPPRTPLGRLDKVLGTPARPPRVPTPDPDKFAAILLESNPVELQRHLLTSTVHSQVLSERLRKFATQHSTLLDKLERSREENEDLRFQLEEKTIELEGTKAKVRQLESRPKRCPGADARERDSMRDAESRGREVRERDSMRDLEPVTIPDEAEARISSTPRRARPSRIPTARRDSGRASPASSASPAPPAHLAHLAHRPPSAASTRSRHSAPPAPPAPAPRSKGSAVPVRRPPHADNNKRQRQVQKTDQDGCASYHDSLNFVSRRRESATTDLIVEYLSRTARLANNQLFSRMTSPRTRPLPADLAYESPQNLALELSKSILYEDANSIDLKTLKSINSQGEGKRYSEDSLWNGKPQQYFESMNYARHLDGDNVASKEFENDSLAL